MGPPNCGRAIRHARLVGHAGLGVVAGGAEIVARRRAPPLSPDMGSKILFAVDAPRPDKGVPGSAGKLELPFNMREPLHLNRGVAGSRVADAFLRLTPPWLEA